MFNIFTSLFFLIFTNIVTSMFYYFCLKKAHTFSFESTTRLRRHVRDRIMERIHVIISPSFYDVFFYDVVLCLFFRAKYYSWNIFCPCLLSPRHTHTKTHTNGRQETRNLLNSPVSCTNVPIINITEKNHLLFLFGSILKFFLCVLCDCVSWHEHEVTQCKGVY